MSPSWMSGWRPFDDALDPASQMQPPNHQLIFIAADGEYKVYASEMHDIADVLADIQWQLAEKGFEWEL